MNIRKDELWKSIIEDFFEDFLHFFYADFVEMVDFSKRFEFLNHELNRLEVDSEGNGRRADMLVKIHLKDNTETWLLIHVEVQGYIDKDFPRRMFIYKYRIFDRLNKPMTALAILTDDNAKYHPTHYEEKVWNTSLRYDFATYKLLDYKVDDLDKINNPFAIIMQTARIFLKNSAIKNDKDLLKIKVQLVKKLLAKGYSKQKVQKLLHFIKVFTKFKQPNFYKEFDNEIDKITGNKKSMGILELIKEKKIEEIKHKVREESLEEGLEKGLEKGLVQGLEKGKLKQSKENILRLIVKKYSDETILDVLGVSNELLEEVRKEEKATSTIKELLKEGKEIAFIQEQLKVSDIFIEIIQEQKKKEHQ